jgi:hypothetical protein
LEAMDGKADTRVPSSPVAASAIRSFIFPQGASPERMASNAGGGEERRLGKLVNTARAVRVLVGPPRVRAVRKAYTIVEARMAYRMIV